MIVAQRDAEAREQAAPGFGHFRFRLLRQLVDYQMVRRAGLVHLVKLDGVDRHPAPLIGRVVLPSRARVLENPLL